MLLPSPGDLVDRAVRERYHVKIVVGARLNIRRDAEVPTEEQAFTLGDVELGQVVGHAIFEKRIVDRDPSPISRQLEAEEVPAHQVRHGGSGNQIAAVLPAEAPPLMKPIAPGATSNFQLNSGSL